MSEVSRRRFARTRFLLAYHRTRRGRMRDMYWGWGRCSLYQEGIERQIAWQDTLARHTPLDRLAGESAPDPSQHGPGERAFQDVSLPGLQALVSARAWAQLGKAALRKPFW